MKAERQHYPTKAAWADAQAARLRAEAAQRAAEYVPSSNWRCVRAKTTALSTIRREAMRYECLAARYRSEGK